ncbi:hypothetical protein L9F63_016908, partial [Diploptera punctata]
VCEKICLHISSVNINIEFTRIFGGLVITLCENVRIYIYSRKFARSLYSLEDLHIFSEVCENITITRILGVCENFRIYTYFGGLRERIFDTIYTGFTLSFGGLLNFVLFRGYTRLREL